MLGRREKDFMSLLRARVIARRLSLTVTRPLWQIDGIPDRRHGVDHGWKYLLEVDSYLVVK